MPSDFSLRERFWRDVAMAAGHRDLDPRAVREAIEDMMCNYHLDEIPGFEAARSAAGHGALDTNNFSSHSAFLPVFARSASSAPLPSSWSCFNVARPIFVGPRQAPCRRRSCSEPRRPPDHFPGGGNPGIRADADQPTHPTPALNDASPWYRTPQLPSWVPHHYIWAFPTGHLAWSPYPQPSPFVPHPSSSSAPVSLVNGHPSPAAMPQWTPGTWPPLDWAREVPIRLSPHIIPNPNNVHLPLIDWNVTKHPSTAKRLTPNHVVVDMDSIWGDPVTHTNARRVLVTCDVGHMSTLWGPITVDQTGPVTLRDLFDAIYQYFQVSLTYPEVQYICALHPSNYRRLTDAYYERCRESTALSGWEAKQGFRRVDVLGDRKYWWGVWITSHRGAWWLNLGLLNPSHCRPQ